MQSLATMGHRVGGYPLMLLDAERRGDPNVVGEDTWDLFLAIEKSFEVDLGDFHELANIRLSELAETICKQANYPIREKCLSTVVFYRLRHSLEVRAGIPSRSIRPVTPLKKLLPWNSRRTRWSEIEEYLDITLPKLIFPSWLLLSCLLFPFIVLISSKIFFGLGISWWSLIGLSAVFVLPTIMACVPLARSIPADCETVGGLVKAILSHNYAKFAMNHGGSSEQNVLAALQLLVALETGLQMKEVLPATRIPANLNIY